MVRLGVILEFKEMMDEELKAIPPEKLEIEKQKE